MNKAEAKERIEFLRKELNRHNALYYVEAHPEISDREYDALYDELKRLEESFPDLASSDSPTQRVGGKPLKEFRSIRHVKPMLSLEKAEDMRELQLYETRVRKALGGKNVEYVVEPKIDGVSIGVRYENGVFTLGVTRGDGVTGDDITANLKTIRDIPLKLMGKGRAPHVVEIRGEVYMREEDRLILNKELETGGLKIFENTRNATAGSLKQLDPKVVAKRRLHCVFYAIGATDGISFKDHVEELEFIKSSGLPPPQLWWTCSNMDEAVKRAEELKQQGDRLPYEIDGAVFKINDNSQGNSLGFTAKAPVAAIAYKPKHWFKRTQTILKDITVQVGRTGVLTPVAELEPVRLEGTTISRATLHNEDEIRKKDIRIGDTVTIERAGKVIPAVVEVVSEKRPRGATQFDILKHINGKCPACGGAVRRDPEFVAWRCENLQCPAQHTRRIEHFASRGALNIEGLGYVVADALVVNGLVKEPLDLFNLKIPALAKLNLGTSEEPRVLGEKNSEKIVQALKESGQLPLSRWLYALGIPDIGETTAYEIARLHPSLNEIANSSILRDRMLMEEKKEELDRVNPKSRKNPPKDEREKAGRQELHAKLKTELVELDKRLEVLKLEKVGPVAARSVLKFFHSEQGAKTLKRLKELGISPTAAGTSPDAQPGESSWTGPASKIAGRTFVLTGALLSMSRSEATAEIRQQGGDVTSSVSAKTGFVIVGENPGEEKTTQAKTHNVPMIKEDEFLKLLGKSAKPAEPKQKELF